MDCLLDILLVDLLGILHKDLILGRPRADLQHTGEAGYNQRVVALPHGQDGPCSSLRVTQDISGSLDLLWIHWRHLTASQKVINDFRKQVHLYCMLPDNWGYIKYTNCWIDIHFK